MTNGRHRNTYIDGCSHFCMASATGFLPLLVDEQAKVWKWSGYANYNGGEEVFPVDLFGCGN